MAQGAAPPLEGLAEGGLALNPLGFGVDVCKADFRAKPLRAVAGGWVIHNRPAKTGEDRLAE